MISPSRALVLGLAFLAAGTLGLQTPARAAGAAGAPAGSAAAPPALTLDALKNAAYKGFEGEKGTVRLVDGRWEGKPYAPGAASRPRVGFVGELVGRGDLDGDGRDEAVVLLEHSGGGTGQFLHVAVVASRNGKAVNVATRFVGDRVQVRALRVAQGRIELDVVRAGPNDAACCPGELASLAWALKRARLEPVDAGVQPARLTAQAAAGTEWVLRRWNSDEAAPAQPEVTLSFRDGQFVGGAGCNRYFAGVTPGELPGDVAVSPPGATRMACPDPAMAIETRFLDGLAHVRKLGFRAGQLALTYEKAGVYGVMLFDPGAAPGGARP